MNNLHTNKIYFKRKYIYKHRKLSLLLLSIYALLILIGITLGSVQASIAQNYTLSWNFLQKDEVIASHSLQQLHIRSGCLVANTKRDPYIYLKLPKGGVSAKEYSYLQIKLYSSTNADHLGVYYKNTLGQWALGLASKVKSGWAIYTINLQKGLSWSPGNSSSKQAMDWGGSGGLITKLRIDPGNQRKRQVRIDWVRLKSTHEDGKDKNVVSSVATLPAWKSSKVSNGHIDTFAGGVSFNATDNNAHLAATTKVQFDHPVQYDLKGIITTEQSSSANVVLRLKYLDVFGNKISDSNNYALSVSKGQHPFKISLDVPRLAAGAVVTASYRSLQSNSKVSIDGNIKLVKRGNNSTTASKWRNESNPPHWIWASSATSSQTVYFRRTFKVSDLQQVSRAIVDVTVDNSYRLFINGHELPVEINANNWHKIDKYEIKPWLRDGTNTIGIKASNINSAAGVLAALSIYLADGKFISVRTGPGWLYSENAKEGWSKSNEASKHKWNKATDLGAPPVWPWKDGVSYFYSGKKNHLKLSEFRIKGKLQPGKNVKVYARLSCKQINMPVSKFALSIVPENGDGSLGTVLWRKKFTNLTDSNVITINTSIKIPKYLPSTSCSIILSAIRSYITGAGTEKNPFNNIKFTSTGVSKHIAAHAGVKTVANPTAKIIYENKQPVLMVNHKPYTVIHYMSFAGAAAKGYIGNTKRNGIHLYFISPRNVGIPSDGDIAYAAVDRQCRALLNVDPNAYIIIGFALDPLHNMAMAGWMKKHKDQLVVDSKGSNMVHTYTTSLDHAPSFASRPWMEVSKQRLKGLIKHVRAQRYGERIIGYAPYNGVSWEWQYWGSVTNQYPPVLVGYSKPYQFALQRWLKNKYTNIANLNSAWHTNLISFSKIKMPSPSYRKQSGVGGFLAPKQYQKLIDIRHFRSWLVAHDILELARLTKKLTNGQSLFGTFYGYVTYVIGPYRFAMTGHFALQSILDSPDVDFLMSPSRYSDRGMGGASGTMTTDASVRLHNKLWIDQADIRTMNSPKDSTPGRQSTLSDTVAILKREFARTLINGNAFQIFGFDDGWTAGDPRLMELAGKMQRIERNAQKSQDSSDLLDTKSTIAVIVSEESTYYTAINSSVHYEAIVRQYPKLYRSGVGIDWYLLSDIKNIPNTYKCYIFANCIKITKKQRRLINSRLKQNGNVLVFIYAAGITNGKKLNAALMSKLIGVKVKWKSHHNSSIFITTSNGKYTYGSGRKFGSMFLPQDGMEIGHLKKNKSIPALVIKRYPKWTSVYSAAPDLPAPLIQRIAILANMRIINKNSSDVTYVGNNLIAIHTVDGGKRNLQLPVRQGVLKELFTGREYSINNHSTDVKLPPRSTQLYQIISDNYLK